jgi:ethanolamine utilization protein EutN
MPASSALSITGPWAERTGMQLAQVIGTLVSTQKHPKMNGAKLLLVQPITPDDRPRGTALLAIDSVGAGVGERVLIVLEGRAAGEALGRKLAPVDAAIVGIVDRVDMVPDADGPAPTAE